MPVSDAQKQAAARWDRANMITVACKLPREKAIQFREACEILGVSRYQVLLDAVDNAIARAKKKSGK